MIFCKDCIYCEREKNLKLGENYLDCKPVDYPVCLFEPKSFDPVSGKEIRKAYCRTMNMELNCKNFKERE